MLQNEKQTNSASSTDNDFWSELDSLEKCYYLGFLMADGYVKSSDNTIGVDLAVRDITW
jgi:hypothetical protein